jgi:hypothetical protein
VIGGTTVIHRDYYIPEVTIRQGIFGGEFWVCTMHGASGEWLVVKGHGKRRESRSLGFARDDNLGEIRSG